MIVLSLYSHLPRASWPRWLTRLWQAVAPGGWLVFSTHGDHAARRAGVALDAQGFHFVADSESSAIDAQQYGTAYTSADFVHTQLSACAPEGVLRQLAPAWFWAHQDAFVLQRPIAPESIA